MADVVIGRAADFPNSGRQVVALEGTEIGVFCIDGRFTAWENVCPHLGGPVCQGKIIPRVREIIADDQSSLGLAFSTEHTNVACPWHGYEFDVQTGRHQGNPHLRLRPVRIEVVDGDLVVTVPDRTRERIARVRPPAGAARDERPDARPLD
jgi:nitrite reductase/ring-hydroxylating ferredoxin subunit